MSFPLSSVAELNNLSICEIHDLSVPAAGRLQSEGADPWIIVSCDGGIRYLHLRLHFNRDYLQDGDTLCIYYLEDPSHSFSEDKCIRIPIDDSDRLEKVLCFTHPVLGLRIDPLERSGSIPLSSMLVSAFETEEQLFDSFAPAVDNGVVVVSQDLSNTGAPILAHNISCAMARKGKAVITLCCNHVSGQLAERYEQKDLALYGLFLLESADNSIPKEEWALRWLRGLRDRGYRSALLNTVISGAFAGLFKQACIHVITLVHETAETIKMHGWIPLAYELSMFSDAVIFPCTSVRDGFLELVDHIVGETVVRPQGVYLADTDSGTVSCDSLFAKLGLGPDDKLVLSSGTIELRKGTDLFISAATSLCHHCQPDEPKPLILWAGDGSDNYRTCLDIQLEHSQLADRIRFVPFMDAARYKALLRRADVFWSTSRNDTFPSVVLEAMYEGVPVVAFSGAMGVDTMLADGRGVLVNDFSPEGMALETLGLLRDAQKAKSISQKARTWVTKELSFSAYIDDLSELCGKPDIVDPAYARSILSADWDESRSNMPLGAAVPISSIRCA